MVQLKRKQTFERIADEYAANGFSYSINYEREVTTDTKGVKAITPPQYISVVAMKNDNPVADANYSGGRNVNFSDATLSAEECKQINNDLFDIFDTVLTQTK
jgi:hypothetical protein|nr:MAG TPA: hypothetical protein [Caudoviricetes sp.]